MKRAVYILRWIHKSISGAGVYRNNCICRRTVLLIFGGNVFTSFGFLCDRDSIINDFMFGITRGWHMGYESRAFNSLPCDSQT